jgi:hypothetical protein
LKNIFPDKKEIVAFWYSGAVIVPHGKMTNYVPIVYGSSYENYIVLRINKGTVIERLDMAEAEFEIYKDKKFQIFKETKYFQEKLEKLMNREYFSTEEQALDFMQNFHAVYYLSL